MNTLVAELNPIFGQNQALSNFNLEPKFKDLDESSSTQKIGRHLELEPIFELV